jgi:hypothetical protein
MYSTSLLFTDQNNAQKTNSQPSGCKQGNRKAAFICLFFAAHAYITSIAVGAQEVYGEAITSYFLT